MASFNNINGPTNKPMIQESQNMQNNGGGGNLGYFQRRKSEEEFQAKEMVDMFEKEDTFESQDGEEGKEGFFSKIINFLKRPLIWIFKVLADIFKMLYDKLLETYKTFFGPKPKKIEKDQFLTLQRDPLDTL